MKKNNILVVDDEPAMRDMLRWHLDDSGFDIKVARDEQEALPIIAAGPIDLVVMDVTIPRLNGFKLLAALKEKNKKPAAIVMTGFGTVELAAYALRQGASDFLLKPLDPRHLANRIREILENRSRNP